MFVNSALTEPFGLTLLEAAASGLPLVATENGGPVDIIGNCRNGLLVDPLDKSAMAEALLAIIENPELWQKFSANGLQNVAQYYSWDAHALAYLVKIQTLLQQGGNSRKPRRSPDFRPRKTRKARKWSATGYGTPSQTFHDG